MGLADTNYVQVEHNMAAGHNTDQTMQSSTQLSVSTHINTTAPAITQHQEAHVPVAFQFTTHKEEPEGCTHST